MNVPSVAETIRTMAGELAINQFISIYPAGASYDDVINWLMDKDPRVQVWLPFEHSKPEDVREYIDDLRLETLEFFRAGLRYMAQDLD